MSAPASGGRSTLLNARYAPVDPARDSNTAASIIRGRATRAQTLRGPPVR